MLKYLLVCLIPAVYPGSALGQDDPAASEPRFAPFADSDPLFADPAKESSIVKRLYAAADDAKAALAAMEELPKSPTELELRALRNLDRELAASRSEDHRRLTKQAVEALAMSGESTSLQYLHKVFDTTPERRALIAGAIARYAIARQRRPHDWSLLVRSLTVVEGDTAADVTGALLKFHQKATSPAVQRNALLVGLKLEDEHAIEVSKLLSHWTGVHPAPGEAPIKQQLAAWQAWYREAYPSLPEAKLIEEKPTAIHRFNDLVEHIKQAEETDLKRGAKVFEKAQCIKCHTIEGQGERVGPDLTKISHRLTTEELVESLLFPSHQVLDQYATRRIETQDGRIYAGIVGEAGDSLIVLPADAKKVTIKKTEIASMQDSPLSAMPEGLLDNLTRDEIVDLCHYLLRADD